MPSLLKMYPLSCKSTHVCMCICVYVHIMAYSEYLRSAHRSTNTLIEIEPSQTLIEPLQTQGAFHHLSPKISSVELTFPSVWRHGYNLNYNLWHTGMIKSKSPCTVLLIFALQVYANLQLRRTPEMLLVYLRP